MTAIIATAMPSETAARWLVGGTLIILGVATIIGQILRLRAKSDTAPPDRRRTVANLNARIRAWWIMVAVFASANYFGRTGAGRRLAQIRPVRTGTLSSTTGGLR